MFGFLKDKLKGALGKLTREVEKDAIVEKKEVLVEKKPEKKEVLIEIKPDKYEEKKIENKDNNIPKTEIKTKTIETPKVEEPKKRGFFQKLFGKKEEEDIIEEKEVLRERAEKTIEEPSPKKGMQKEIKKASKIQTIPKSEPAAIQTHSATASTEDKVEIQEKSTIKSFETAKETNNTATAPIITPEIKSEITRIETKKIESVEPSIEPRSSPSKTVSLSPIVPKPQPHYQTVEKERAQKVVEHKDEEPKGFFAKITETFTKIQISDEKFEELFWELEIVLLENNVAVEVIDKIKRDLKRELMTGKVSRKGVEDLILSTLRQSITELFDVEKINLIDRIKEKRKNNMPYIIAIIGVNGSGKTTSIAKLTHKFQKEGLSVVLAASDTFRAAAIQQLEEHANKLNVKMVKHDYNSDPAAVAFDAIKYAEARNIDVVIIDTAGRLHSNTNLMRELEKVIRVCKPDIKIFVGESITGNDCVEQAKEFDKAVGIDAIILAKADVDDKGGAAISVSYILQRPILYLGTGQAYDDLKDFDSKLILESLEL